MRKFTDRVLRLCGGLAVLLMAVGAVGTWEKEAQVLRLVRPPVHGLDRDGAVVLICAAVIAASLLIARRWLRIAAVLAAGVSTVVGIYNVVDVSRQLGSTAGAGLVLVIAASMAAGAIALALIVVHDMNPTRTVTLNSGEG